ncbi:hypothetical protein, unlikely [Trypanosoma brucei gambiense DAL972]|uniref:Uncharacterized protein n=1 Tax=Trypanosoma brucei gambiense (strain MHOM/CI/86/DAL972) TaxID=679716 RepID=C9ZP68_TRYB9|nr:hypothetical protein, unlikely [Trypanosoma brucei gambiense DAL972]CBH11196.1 hypothetical protein, unlikely [Trypanosoma brucei gambiense DAL972]|eukprot:XP_011773483.1 hypothetical protein, unlikely [Trypanosoma brucei gambiense DAL972]
MGASGIKQNKEDVFSLGEKRRCSRVFVLICLFPPFPLPFFFTVLPFNLFPPSFFGIYIYIIPIISERNDFPSSFLLLSFLCYSLSLASVTFLLFLLFPCMIYFHRFYLHH